MSVVQLVLSGGLLRMLSGAPALPSPSACCYEQLRARVRMVRHSDVPMSAVRDPVWAWQECTRGLSEELCR